MSRCREEGSLTGGHRGDPVGVMTYLHITVSYVQSIFIPNRNALRGERTGSVRPMGVELAAQGVPS